MIELKRCTQVQRLIDLAKDRSISRDELAPPLVHLLWLCGVKAPSLIFFSSGLIAAFSFFAVGLFWHASWMAFLLSILLLPLRWFIVASIVNVGAGYFVDSVVWPILSRLSPQIFCTEMVQRSAWIAVGLVDCAILAYLRQDMLRGRLLLNGWDDVVG